MALAKEQIQDIVREAIKKTKAVKTSKQVIKYLGTGRGEDVIAAQERAVKAIEPVNTANTIVIEAQSGITDINLRISDFSSAVDLDLKAEEVAVEILSKDSDSSKDKTKTRKTTKKSQSKAEKKSSTKQSKSNQRTKKDLTANKKSSRAYDLLAACKVELIVLDEFHHFIDRESQRVLRNVCDWLKNLILNTRIPVVLFGLPESKRILKVDNSQLSRRFTYRHELIPFPYSESGMELFRQFLSNIEGQLPLEANSGLAEKSRSQIVKLKPMALFWIMNG